MHITKEIYARTLNGLDHSKRIYFYEVFAHNLTVSIRAVWSDTDITDGEKVAGMKEINEILHRITAKISAERRQTQKLNEEDIYAMLLSVPDYKANPKGHIGAALKSTFKTLGIEIPNNTFQ